jgi:hypothetical protein
MRNKKLHEFFDEKFDLDTSALDFLPIFHSCDAFFLRSILVERKLIPSVCTIFKNEQILYFFYGRPSYKNSSNLSSGLHALLPISIILKADAITDIIRIAPFDTGAFTIGLYKEYLHPEMTLDSFFITPTKQSISKTVAYFFSSNEQYFASKPKNELKYDAMDFEIQSYHNLLKGIEQSPTDDRKASIEIQIKTDIELTNDTIEAIIIPEHFLASKFIQDAAKSLNARFLTYESYGLPSKLYYSQILALTKKYLKDKHYL